jgi:hypothetical protein
MTKEVIPMDPLYLLWVVLVIALIVFIVRRL